MLQYEGNLGIEFFDENCRLLGEEWARGFFVDFVVDVACAAWR
jgi:hypothetical protein